MLAAPLPATLVDPSRPQNAPRIGSLALQHFRSKQPLFSFSQSEESPENIALFSESPAFRVWLPSSRRCFLAAPTLEASFSPQRSWASPFRALLPSSNSKPVSRLRFRSCVFLQDHMGLVPTLQRFHPTRRAVSLNATRSFSSGRDLLPSWVFRFLGFSPETAQEKIVSLFSFPFHSGDPKTSRFSDSRCPRAFSTAPVGISLRRVPTRTTFFADCTRHLFKPIARHGLFFPLEGPQILTNPNCSLFVADVHFPNGRW